MSERYGETVTTAPHTEQPKHKFGIRWWIYVVALCCVQSLLWRAAYQTGNWVLVAAMWAALLTFVTVLFRSALKQERRRRMDESKAAAGA